MEGEERIQTSGWAAAPGDGVESWARAEKQKVLETFEFRPVTLSE